VFISQVDITYVLYGLIV